MNLLKFDDKELKWKELKELVVFSQGIQVAVTNKSLNQKEGFIRFLRIVDFVKDNELPRYNPGNVKSDGNLVMIRYGASAAGKVFLKFSGAIANSMFSLR